MHEGGAEYRATLKGGAEYRATLKRVLSTGLP